jgi:TetR/AcrR family transcriptional repressor of nem operon
MDINTTRGQLVHHAQRLIREHGYNGFSYRDLARLIGVKTSSIHYHFPQKEDLLLAAIHQYRQQWREQVGMIGEDLAPTTRLQRYLALHLDPVDEGKLVCLAGALACNLASLPQALRLSLQDYYRANEKWLTHVLDEGVRDGSIALAAPPEVTARALFAALQGALLASRLFQTTARLDDILPSVQVYAKTLTLPMAFS